MTELNIPSEHINKFIYFIELPEKTKQEFFSGLSSYDGSLTDKMLVNYLTDKIDLKKEKISDLVNIYLSMINSKNAFDGTLDEFIKMLLQSLSNHSNFKVILNENLNIDFKNLLESSAIIYSKSKVIDIMTENAITFLDAKIHQDLRTVFDENNEILGSAIVHNLKIIIRENDNVKNIFVALDENDLDKLLVEIKKSQEHSKILKSKFENAKILKGY